MIESMVFHPELAVFQHLIAHVITAVPDHKTVIQEMVRVCRPGGRIVLSGHCQFLSVLKQGTISYHIGDNVTSIPVDSGVAEVTSTQVTILVDALREDDEVSPPV